MEYKSPIERNFRKEFIESINSFSKKELIERLILFYDDLEYEKKQGELKNGHISDINARLSLYEKLGKSKQQD